MKRILWIVLALAVVGAFVFREPLLTSAGSYLVKAGPPEKADAVLVLAGGTSGERILKGAELVRQGYASKVLVSGPGGEYGLHECDLAIPYALRSGYPESYFVHEEHEAKSTVEEAEAFAPILKDLHASRILLVTSNFHTRRATKIFRRIIPEVTFIPIAADDRYFSPAAWWKNREGRKTFLYESMKTVANWF